jgi:hypothetical protein
VQTVPEAGKVYIKWINAKVFFLLGNNTNYAVLGRSHERCIPHPAACFMSFPAPESVSEKTV